MPRLTSPLRVTPTSAIAGLIAFLVGLFYFYQWLSVGGGFQQSGSWIPILSLAVALLCLVSAMGIALGQRWAVLLFLLPATIILLRAILALTTPPQVPLLGDVLDYFFTIILRGTLAVGCFLLVLVMWFRNKWLTILGLPLAALAILPSFFVLLSMVTANLPPFILPGTTVVSDTFDDVETNEWFWGTPGLWIRGSYADGVLHWNFIQEELDVPLHYALRPRDKQQLINFDASVEMKSDAAGTVCSFGLGFRDDLWGQRAHYFTVTNEGRWILSSKSLGDTKTIQEGTFAPLPSGKMNLIELQARQSTLSAQVNGESIPTISNVPVHPGDITLAIYNFGSKEPCHVDIDNLHVIAR